MMEFEIEKMCFMFYKLLLTEYIKSLLEMIVCESLIQTHNSEKQIACWTHYARYMHEECLLRKTSIFS